MGLLLLRPAAPVARRLRARRRRSASRGRSARAAVGALARVRSAARRRRRCDRSTISPVRRSSRGTAPSCSRSSRCSSGAGSPLFGDRRVQSRVVAVVVALGLVGGVRNLVEQRTQAGQVAAVLRRRGAGPVISSSIAPTSSARRCTGSCPAGLDEVTYPDVRVARVRRLGRLPGAPRRGRSGRRSPTRSSTGAGPARSGS